MERSHVPRTPWIAAALAFAAGLGATVAGLHLTAPTLRCQIAAAQRTCTTRVVGEELVYTGLALLAVALLTAVVLLAHDSRREV